MQYDSWFQKHDCRWSWWITKLFTTILTHLVIFIIFVKFVLIKLFCIFKKFLVTVTYVFDDFTVMFLVVSLNVLDLALLNVWCCSTSFTMLFCLWFWFFSLLMLVSKFSTAFPEIFLYILKHDSHPLQFWYQYLCFFIWTIYIVTNN